MTTPISAAIVDISITISRVRLRMAGELHRTVGRPVGGVDHLHGEHPVLVAVDPDGAPRRRAGTRPCGDPAVAVADRQLAAAGRGDHPAVDVEHLHEDLLETPVAAPALDGKRATRRKTAHAGLESASGLVERRIDLPAQHVAGGEEAR
jgi:hypothetical protein